MPKFSLLKVSWEIIKNNSEITVFARTYFPERFFISESFFYYATLFEKNEEGKL